MTGVSSGNLGVYRGIKRILDVGAAGIGLLLTAPLLALIGLSVRLTLGKPVLYRQPRAGLHGRRFVIVKFRTMRPLASGVPIASDDEARLTRLGRFLRASSLDELPELANVLRGEMSLVGPRPLLLEYLERYTPEQARRHAVKPGITGWAQINGRNALSWEDKFRFDVWYVEHAGLLLDLRILARTLGQVLRRDGIAAEGHSTAPPFTGDAGNSNRGHR